MVFVIVNNSTPSYLWPQMLQDTQLIALILVLLLIDCVIATLWVTFDPLQRQLRNLTMEYAPGDRGVVYLPQVGTVRNLMLSSKHYCLFAR